MSEYMPNNASAKNMRYNECTTIIGLKIHICIFSIFFHGKKNNTNLSSIKINAKMGIINIPAITLIFCFMVQI